MSHFVATATPFAAALRRITASAPGSTSTAVTGSKPARAAATASTPLPAPQSHSGPPGSSSSSNASASRVVGCVPAPKNRSGSITRSPASPSIHGGRTTTPPIRTGRRKSCQRRSQPASTGSSTTSTTAVAGQLAHVRSDGSSPGGA